MGFIVGGFSVLYIDSATYSGPVEVPIGPDDSVGVTFQGGTWWSTFGGPSPQHVVLQIDYVPEPSSLALLAVGVLLLSVCHRRGGRRAETTSAAIG